MPINLIDVAGWFGGGMLLFAYALVSLGKYETSSILYRCLNIFGSALLIVNTAYYGAYPSAFVNIVWIAIALLALPSLRKR